MEDFADFNLSGDLSGDPYASVNPLLFSAVLIALTIGVMLALIWCQSQGQRELLWTVDLTESEKRRTLSLLLPHTALEWPKARETTPRRRSHLVKRVGEATGLVSSAQQGGWVFRPELAGTDCTPLLVFVNRGSGGRQGAASLLHLRRVLSPHQVVDMDQGNAEEVLQSFGTVGRFRVLVCGGDGTVGWVLSLLDGAGLEYTPPLAILPLGTGNDLARALGWGKVPALRAARDWVSVLEEVERAQVALLDRWQVSIEHARSPSSVPARRVSTLGLSASVANLRNTQSIPNRAPRNLIMQNYIGIGVDAKVALAWHQRRQRQPQSYKSRWRNKLRYARDGVQQMLSGAGDDVSRLMAGLVVEADGVPIELPPHTQGLIVLNIPSYGGGSDLWGIEEEEREGQPWPGGEDMYMWGAKEVEARRERGGQKVFESTSLTGHGGASRPATPSTTGSHGHRETPPRSPTPVGAEMAEAAEAEVAATSAGAEAAAVLRTVGRAGGASHHRSSSDGSSGGRRTRPATPPNRSGDAFVPPSMDDGLLEVVTVQGVLQLGLAQMSLSGARRLCQCSRLTVRSTDTRPVQVPPPPPPRRRPPARLRQSPPRPSSSRPLRAQVDGEPFELEPMFAPRKAMTISVRHHNQAVMLSQSRVRADGVALEALDWALQEGVISVEQRNCVLREVARRTGKLQRAESSRPGGGMQSFGSSVSLEAFNHRLESFNHRL
jgi:hypothetical protein